MITKKEVETLERFEVDINGENFVRLFMKAGGEKWMGEHLWRKFAQYDHSALRLWSSLDLANRPIFIRMVNEFAKEREKEKLRRLE